MVDLDDAKAYAIIGSMVILGLLAVVLPVCIFVNIGEQRKVDLEKYKIEMQYKNGDIPISIEEEN